MDNQFNNGNDPWNQYGNQNQNGNDAQFGPNYSEGNGTPQFGPGYNNGNYGQNYGGQDPYGNMGDQYGLGQLPRKGPNWVLIVAVAIGLVAALAIVLVFGVTKYVDNSKKKTEAAATEETADSKNGDSKKQLLEGKDSSSSGSSKDASTDTTANADESTDSSVSDTASADGSTDPSATTDSSTSPKPSDIDWSYVTDDMKYTPTGIGTDMSISDFKASCTEMDYDDVLAHPEKYIGKNMYFYGDVISDLKTTDGINTQYYDVMPFDYEKAQSLYKQYNNLNSFDWTWSTSVFCTYDIHKLVFAFDTQDQSKDTYLSGFKSKTVQFYGTFGGLCETTDSATLKTIYRIGFDIKYAQLTPEQDSE